MSLEAKIDGLIIAFGSLTDALNKVSALMQGAAITHNPAAPVVPQPAAQSFAPPPPAQPAFVPPAAPAAPAAPPQQFAPVMPPPPNFGAVPAAPAAPAVPFSDANGLVHYATETYKQLATSPAEAQRIQDGMNAVLSQLGVTAASAVQPHQYAAFYAGIEALRPRG